jgi:AcrR family transcriptional regulator
MTDHNSSTKQRILAAAGEIFGIRGFKDTTIRTIARAAEANIAAINYHFGDKEGLYRAVLEEVFSQGFSRFPGTIGCVPGAGPEERLRAFIRAMFYRLHSQEGWGGIAGRGRLIARELLEPSPAFEAVIDRYVKPHRDLLVAILRDLSGSGNPEKLLPCAISIIGQCIYYAMASPVIHKISPENAPTEHNLDRLADFVWCFSLGGIMAITTETPTQSTEPL